MRGDGEGPAGERWRRRMDDGEPTVGGGINGRTLIIYLVVSNPQLQPRPVNSMSVSLYVDHQI